MKPKIIHILIVLAVAILLIGAYKLGTRSKPIDLMSDTQGVKSIKIKTPSIVKSVNREKKQLPVLVYNKEELKTKYKLEIGKDEEVGAIVEKKTDTGTEYITSKIKSSGENVIDVKEIRSKFRVTFDPSIYAEAKIFGNDNSDIARMGLKLNVAKINGNIDVYAKGEVSMNNGSGKTQTGLGAYVGVEWHLLK